MRKPLFASKWYKDTPANELRQEVQNLYRSIEEAVESIPEVDLSPLETSIEELVADLTDLDAALADYLPLTGGTLTGDLTVQGNDLVVGGVNTSDTSLWLRRSGATHSWRLLNTAGHLDFYGGDNAASLHRLRITSGGVAQFQGDVELANAGTATNQAVRADRSISAGNGLTGGGNLTANRSLALGTPGTITASTSNSVSASSHTHELALPTVRGEVGCYALCRRSGTTSISDGGTIAGSNLRYVSFQYASGTMFLSDSSTIPSGTWRNLGGTMAAANYISVFVRVS